MNRKIIVSGVERSGTSLMMQILGEIGFNLCYDEGRKPDYHNPNGYYEVNNGKIIHEISKGDFKIKDMKDEAMKITSFGLTLMDESELPEVIYMTRNPKEIAKSQRKMVDDLITSLEKDISLIKSLDNYTMKYLIENNINHIIINYNNLIKNPDEELNKLSKFLGIDASKGKNAIDKDLYRNRCKEMYVNNV